MDNIYVSRMNDNMTNEYDNMTMTMSHDIMTDTEVTGNSSQCININ